MPRFTSVHPLTLTEPAARFTPVEGDPELFEVESDDPAVVTALRGLGDAFGISEDDSEDAPAPAPQAALTPAQEQSQPVPTVPDNGPQD